MTDLALAKIEGEEIVIRIPISALPMCVTHAMDEQFGPGQHGIKVADVKIFAKEFVSELNREDEVGDTCLHRTFDKALVDCVGNGAEGIDV